MAAISTFSVQFGNRVFRVNTGMSGVAGLAAQRAEAAEAEALALRDQTQALRDSASGVLASAVKNGATGQDVRGPVTFDITGALRLGFSVITLDGSGGKIDWLRVDTTRKKVELYAAEVGNGFSAKQVNALGLSLTPSGAGEWKGAAVFDPPATSRAGIGIAGLGYMDGLSGVFRPAFLPRADYALPKGALVTRGRSVGLNKPQPRVQLLHGGHAHTVYQGAAMETALPIASRSHQMVPSLAKVGGWLYACWFAVNGTNDAAYPANEAAGNYLVVARKPIGGTTWTEIARIAPADMANGRAYDPQIGATPDGRLVILWAYSALGATIYHWSAGCWLTVLENPEIATSGRFVFTIPEFVEYGIPSPPFVWRGELCLPIDVWRRSGNFPAVTTTLGWDPNGPVVKGSRLFRLSLAGERPFVEALSAPLPDISGANDFSETQIVPLDGGKLLAHQRTTAGIRSFLSDSALSAWTGPTDISTDIGGMTCATRTALIRTMGGNLAWVGNNAGPNRFNMTLRLSQDADGVGGTFLWKSISLDPRSDYQSSYPVAVSWIDAATGRVKIGAVWDRGRGVGAGYPAQILYAEVFEDEVVAGTAGTPAIEVISSI